MDHLSNNQRPSAADSESASRSSVDLTDYIDCLSGTLDVRYAALGGSSPSKYSSIGSGSFTSCTSDQAGFSGTVDIDIAGLLKYSGNVDATFDESAGTVEIMGSTFDATFSTDDGYLKVEFTADDWDIVLWIQKWDGGTYMRVDVSVVSPRFWIGPTPS